MWLQQMFTTFLCVLLASQKITAVVNNGQSNVQLENESNSTKIDENSDASNNPNNVADSVASSSDSEANRRDAPLVLSETYGAPLTAGDTYLPPEPSNIGLPHPVYGVPNAPTNNIVYPAPPPDIPPPLPSAPVLFKPSNDLHGLQDTYGPPKDNILHLKDNFRPPPLPPLRYGPPSFLQRPPKPHSSFSFNAQKSQKHFGPLPQIKPHFKPKPLYGPPKLQFRPPKPPKSNYGPPKFSNFNSNGYFGLSPPKGIYGPPKFNQNQGVRYGPPDPVPHGPPHPGAPAPPTPPDIKYDGWQPIPGLVSRPPSSTYGAPNNNNGGHHNDIQLNVDFAPPHLDISHSSSFGSSLGHQFLDANYVLPSDSYGAPLNAVTDSADQEEHPGLSIGLASVGLGNNVHDDSLSVVKSIGYELYLNNAGNGFGDGLHQQDTYSAPPLNAYSPDGPYAAAHSYNNANGGSFGGFNSHGGLSLSSSGIGLIPPSGVYGVPPSGNYGTPLLLPPRQQHGHALNALEINPPKHPVIFREPVPNGLIESIGNSVAQKDAHGIIEHSSSYTGGPAYIPPPVPDITKPVQENHLHEPSSLYSLPSNDAPISFQNVVHESSSAGLGGYSSNFHTAGHLAEASALTSYATPLGTIDGSYSFPLETVALDHTHAASTIDLTNNFASALPASYNGGYHDCSLHKSQPLSLPQLSYGVPSANSYTASLSSLTANIGGGLQSHQDLQTAHSQSSSVTTNALLETHGKEQFGKALAGGGQLIKSQSVDFNNIPVQGALGSYTLQIQPADSLGSSSSPHVPHEQLLNDGLLRSILAAIEQPQQKLNQQQYVQLPNFNNNNYNNNYKVNEAETVVEDTEADNSAKNVVVITPTPLEDLNSANGTYIFSKNETEASSEENEIALYFNNNPNKRSSEDSAVSEENNNKDDVNNKVLNGQQYGSFVSFKTPKTSFSYGDLDMSQTDASTSEAKTS